MSIEKTSSGEVVVLIVAYPFAAMWHGFVGKTLWGWFVVPTFGLPMLTLPVAIGLGLTISFWAVNVNVQPRYKEIVELIAISATRPAVALLVGWIVKGFM